MSVKLKLNLTLQKLAGNREEIEVNGSTVEQCLDDLIKRLPGAKQHIFNEDGSTAVLLLNNEPLPGQDLKHPVIDHDELWLLSIVNGG